jgi:ATP:ADP antiporter, AAA family
MGSVNRHRGSDTGARNRDLLPTILLAANLFLILFAYYLLKTVRETWILVPEGTAFLSGPKLKSFATALQALLLLAAVPLYARLSRTIERGRLIRRFTGYFVVCLLAFALALALELPYGGFFFYVWLGTFNVAAVAQFWSFATSLFDAERGMRVFTGIAFGATAGGFVGAKAAGLLFGLGLGLGWIITIAASILVLHLGLYGLAERFARPVRAARVLAAPRSGEAIDGLRLVARDSYLRWVVALVILLSVVNTTGEYLLSEAVMAEANAALAIAGDVDARAFIAAFVHDFYSEFYLYVNIAAIGLQAFVVGRLIRVGGIAAALLVLPVLAFFAYGLVATSASLVLIKWVKIAENGSDYSVMNTARSMLFLPTTEEEKWRARQVVDTIVVRFGDVLSFMLVASFALAGLPASGLVWVNLLLVVGWGVAALKVHHRWSMRVSAPRASA